MSDLSDPKGYREALYKDRPTSLPDLPETELVLCGKCREYYDISKSNLCPECCKPVSRKIDFALKEVMIEMNQFFEKKNNIWCRRTGSV